MIVFPSMILKKMTTTFADGQVNYQMEWADQILELGPGLTVTLLDTKKRVCVACHKSVSKLFAQGFCYPCFTTSPDNSECIIRPELCRAHEGIGRDPEWEERNHNQPHVVYLANSAGLKVGITRSTQIPTRWIDQGAISAIPLARVPNRYLSGCIEMALKPFVSDRTPWQKMVRGIDPELDLVEIREQMRAVVPAEYHAYLVTEPAISLQYPVTQYPEVAKSIKLDTNPEIHGILTGIRGQYLMLDGNRVLNVRNHSGYCIDLTVDSID